MKKSIVILIVLVAARAIAGPLPDTLTRTATIVHVSIPFDSFGASDSLMLAPIHDGLTRLFKLGEVIDVVEPGVQWVGRFGKTPSIRKLKSEDKDLVVADAPRTDLIVVVRVDHSYNNVLLIANWYHHVIKIHVAVFDRTGERVWYKKEKANCCTTIGADAEDESLNPITPEDFMKLYQQVAADVVK